MAVSVGNGIQHASRVLQVPRDFYQIRQSNLGPSDFKTLKWRKGKSLGIQVVGKGKPGRSLQCNLSSVDSSSFSGDSGSNKDANRVEHSPSKKDLRSNGKLPPLEVSRSRAAFDVSVQQSSSPQPQVVRDDPSKLWFSAKNEGLVMDSLLDLEKIDWFKEMESVEVAENDKKGNLESILERDADLAHNRDDGDIASKGQKDPKSKKGQRRSQGELAKRWRDIQGAGNWQGLLEPMDSVLREEVMKYGEFAQANYDAFDFEPRSKYCGSSRFNKKKLLQEVGLGDSGYEVTKYLYAMSDIQVPKFFRRSADSDPWSRDSNWMGFVTVATDEEEIKRLGRRDIVISWRGTVMALEWLEDVRDFLTPLSPGSRRKSGKTDRHVKVESGFFSLYTSKDEKTRYNKNSAAEQVKEEVRRLVELYADEELSITITGHSLGGALALLSAYDIAHSKLNERPKKQQAKHTYDHTSERRYSSESASTTGGSQKADSQTGKPTLGSIPVSVFTFAGPRVGDDAFRDRLEELGVHVLRVVNVHDIVPKVPGLFINEKFFEWFGAFENFVSPWLDRLPWTYTHVGVELKLDHKSSPMLDADNTDYSSFHNLEASYLHVLDGYHGPNRPFSSATGRDIALVNKSCGLLKTNGIPPSWWQQENKGLVRSSNGLWVQPDREEDDRPSSNAHDRWV